MKHSLLGIYIIICASTGLVKAQQPAISGKSNIDLSVYPNPATEDININLLSAYGETYTLGIYNAVGELVHSQPLGQSNINQPVRVDLSSFQKGIYIIQLNGTDSKLTRKLILK